ncbi:transpeptidase-transglycosylase [Clostridium botulinum]|uniref:transpeptidase-transglycosylase n=1 Tax=Clostridium botulinum TaxID=1491 RepID=UPI000585CCD2|nr:transpeptidase-transglycosylase [Clostridium botulinum]AJD26329.1 putative multimodular transpeptidase-transglycosylase [Clostridium botulinum CDC_297]MBY6876872.1 transpeptidase-transglycosylase [Clostridium botulinum]MBY6891015.1 transpeptidase-transglycosylase [Clostridium botulinum]MBY6894619.1 transpeptidase-transglycosylase [Clostridium botulinum]MBY6901489.1 transpeptidase-transglycosylase [Clostridium botulinum]
MDKFRNMKKSHIALLVVMYMVLMGSFPRFTGWATIFSAIAVGGYFLKNKKDLKELTRKKKNFIFTGIIILAIIGSLNVAVGNNIQNEKLMAEKAKQEQEIKQEEQKKIEEKKLAEEQKRIQEEEAKKKAAEEKRKQEEEAKKKAAEEQKKQEELKRKQEEENKIKVENEQAQAAFAQSTGKGNSNDQSNESENVDNNQNYTVYKTRTGSKYHSSGCRYLKKSCYETTVSQARNEGLSPCSVCNP